MISWRIRRIASDSRRALGSMRFQIFWNSNITGDNKRRLWANFVEFGPGARFRVPAMPPALMFSVNTVRGVYTINQAGLRRVNFYYVRVGLLYAATAKCGLGIRACCLLVLHLPALLAAAIPLGDPTAHYRISCLSRRFWRVAANSFISSIAFQAQPLTSAGILLLRAGTPSSPQWSERVEQGAFVVLEGASDAAQMFGFRASKDRVVVGSVEDIHLSKLPIIWQKALELPRFELPKQAQVFAKERWQGAPLIAGYASGRAAVLWIATDPGEHGYERFPYILQALDDLGLKAPFRSVRLWAFFDHFYRLRVDLDYLAGRWRASGIAGLHVAAWHFL